ncbi:MAG: hypothetical protein KDK70_12845 [Myxococcales bacterium]|nr:hypothetical protein [Myxococcales bacterium]
MIGRRARVLPWLAVAALLGCARPSRGTEPPPRATVEPLSLALVGEGGGALADRGALDRLLEAPEVTAAGQRLLARLADDPALEPLYRGFMADLLQQPALLEAMAAMAARSPGLSIDELSAQVVTRLSEGIDGPVFDAALDGSLDRLLDQPSVDAAFGRLTSALIDRARLSERLSALLRQWQPELEAAVGVPMSDDRFLERFEAHVSAPQRSARLRELLRARVEEQPRIRQGLAALLDDEAFFRACAHLLQRVLESPGFEANTTAIFAGMLEQVDLAQMRQRVDRVLVTPEIERAVVAWVEEVIASEALTTLADQLGAVLDDPHLQAELFDVLVGASAGPTA